MAEVLRSTNIVKEFIRAENEFRGVEHIENSGLAGFECLEGQVAFMLNQGTITSDDEVMQALAAAGLDAVDKLLQKPPRSWDYLSANVVALATRFVSAFDPDVNEEIAKTAETFWESPEDAAFHFRIWSSVIARLMRSVKSHRNKRDTRSYCRFVLEFVEPFPESRKDGSMHWALWSRKAPTDPATNMEES